MCTRSPASRHGFPTTALDCVLGCARALALQLFFLPDAGCPTNEYSAEAVGMAPLHWAATEGRLRASAWLLGPGGADPEGRDNQVKKRHPPPFVL